MMVALMVGVMLIIGLGFLGTMFFRSGGAVSETPQGGWRPGFWGLGPLGMIFPCIGIVMILIMMSFFFFRMMGGGGRMPGMMRRGGPMSWMTGDDADRQPPAKDMQSQDPPTQDSPVPDMKSQDSPIPDAQSQDSPVPDVPSQDSPVPDVQSPDSQDESRNACSACGARVQADWSVCPHCGHGLG